MSVLAVQLHAEVCYAECQLQRAALTFLQVRAYIFYKYSNPHTRCPRTQRLTALLQYSGTTYLQSTHLTTEYCRGICLQWVSCSTLFVFTRRRPTGVYENEEQSRNSHSVLTVGGGLLWPQDGLWPWIDFFFFFLLRMRTWWVSLKEGWKYETVTWFTSKYKENTVNIHTNIQRINAVLWICHLITLVRTH